MKKFIIVFLDLLLSIIYVFFFGTKLVIAAQLWLSQQEIADLITARGEWFICFFAVVFLIWILCLIVSAILVYIIRVANNVRN